MYKTIVAPLITQELPDGTKRLYELRVSTVPPPYIGADIAEAVSQADAMTLFGFDASPGYGREMYLFMVFVGTQTSSFIPTPHFNFHQLQAVNVRPI